MRPALPAFAFLLAVSAPACSAEFPSSMHGVEVGTTLVDLVDHFDARETTAIPDSPTEEAARFAAESAERAQNQGYRRFAVQAGSSPRVEAYVDSGTRRVFSVRYVGAPEDFGNAVSNYTLTLGTPTVTAERLIPSLSAQWSNGQRKLVARLHVSMGPVPEEFAVRGVDDNEKHPALGCDFTLIDLAFRTSESGRKK